ncbi:MAG: GNAT family N-acetyltransferase [Anaerolineae bacterium]|nr:GNAT family N-acetyltransferase [Anaerolineae bacterium]
MLTPTLLSSTIPCDRPLDDGLRLRSLRDENDLERLSKLYGDVFGAEVVGMTRALVLHHPTTSPEHWLFIEDEANGQIVSALALLPWTWRYEDVTLQAGEMGIVATADGYRNRGLIRTLVGRFKELLREQEFDISQIEGIPYFYRQFGYEYAMPLEPNWYIELHDIPDAASEAVQQYTYHPATLHDIPVLMQMYDEAASSLEIHNVRSEGVWRFLFEQAENTASHGETWLIMDAQQQIVGYFRISQIGFGNGLIVSETSRLSNTLAEALLHQLKHMAITHAKPNIRLNIPATSDLVKVARCWGARDTGTYAWQIHLPDIARLLRKLMPVLERRIANSPFAGLSQNVCLNLYKETFELRFVQGKLTEVASIGYKEGGEIRIPPLLFAPLLLGYRSREELNRCYPDVSIWGRSQFLIDVLFPKLESFFYTNY